MEITRDPEYYKGIIRRSRQNIASVKSSNFTDKEKKDLTLVYQHQIRRAEQKLLSFLSKQNK